MSISRECQAILDYVESTGLPYRVTDITGTGHAPGSYHYATGTGGVGLAVDLAGVLPGVTAITAAQMVDLYRALRNVAPQLAELIHAGPGITQAVKNGRLVDGPAAFGPATWSDHRDHIHVAVPRGTFLTPLSHPLRTLEVPVVPDDPNLPNLPDIKWFIPVVSSTGECTGYYIVSADGQLHAFGPGAKYYGRSEVVR